MTPDAADLAAELADLRRRIEALEEAPREAAPRVGLSDLVGGLREALPKESGRVS
jgi:hypothetical protein